MDSTVSGVFLSMRKRWVSLANLLPFFDYCANHFQAKQPFQSTGSYVFNPGRPIALCTLYTPEVASYAAESEKSLLSYCLRHNYTAYVYRAPLYPAIHPAGITSRLITALPTSGTMAVTKRSCVTSSGNATRRANSTKPMRCPISIPTRE